MKLHDFFSPVRRRKKTFLGLFVLLFVATMVGISALPSVEKITHFYTVKAVDESPAGNHYYSTEGSERAADVISGWAKDGGFHNAVLETAGVDVPNFKKDITARKQNRFNVYFAVNFWPDHKDKAQAVMDSVRVVLTQRLDAFNAGNTSRFILTEPSISGTIIAVPLAWGAIFALFLSLGLAFVVLYWYEAHKNVLSYEQQIFEIYGDKVALLRLHTSVGNHDAAFLEQFVMTFASPRLIGVFDSAEAHFNLAPRDSIDEDRDTPVLILKMGETNRNDLENLKAIFGTKIGIVLFS